MLDAAHSRPPVATEGIAAETQRLGFKRASHPQTEALLRTLAASKPGGTLLELGTGTGMGTAWLLDGMDASARLLTLDQNEETVAIARKYLGADTRVKFLLVDVAEFVQAQPASSFDLIFADCYPGKFYLLDEALALLKKGGIYVVDDMRPAPEGGDEERQVKVRALIEKLEAMPGLRVLKLNWSTGIVLAVKR